MFDVLQYIAIFYFVICFVHGHYHFGQSRPCYRPTRPAVARPPYVALTGISLHSSLQERCLQVQRNIIVARAVNSQRLARLSSESTKYDAISERCRLILNAHLYQLHRCFSWMFSAVITGVGLLAFTPNLQIIRQLRRILW